MFCFHPYSKTEIDSAYALVMLKNKCLFDTWHKDPLENIVLRTQVCKEIIDFITLNYHCLGVSVDNLAVRVEHYHYVLSKNEVEYLNAETLISKIMYFCQANNICLINFRAL